MISWNQMPHQVNLCCNGDWFTFCYIISYAFIFFTYSQHTFKSSNYAAMQLSFIRSVVYKLVLLRVWWRFGSWSHPAHTNFETCQLNPGLNPFALVKERFKGAVYTEQVFASDGKLLLRTGLPFLWKQCAGAPETTNFWKWVLLYSCVNWQYGKPVKAGTKLMLKLAQISGFLNSNYQIWVFVA